MKKARIFWKRGSIALFFAVCGIIVGCEDYQADRKPEQELSFRAHVDGALARASSTNWDKDTIGVFMADVASGIALELNKRFSTISDGVFNACETADRVVLPEGKTVDLYAYYPHNAGTTGFNIPVNVADQSNQSRLDLLYAKVGGISSFSPSPVFTFKRQMVKLVFNVAAGRGIVSLNKLVAKVSGAPTCATFDVKGDTVSIDRSSVIPFDANVAVFGSTAAVEVTLLPDVQSTPSVTFTLAGSSFTWQADRTFEAGKRYTYNLTLTDNNAPATPANKYFETPVVPANGLGTDFIYYELDLPDRAGRNYQIFYDTKELIAHWVAYPLYASIMSSGNRTDAWAFDPNIPTNLQQRLNSGYGGNYDRGHQLPSADRNYNTTVNRTTFYYTNMTPQNREMNQKIWNNLEQQVRVWAKECDTLYIVTGASLTTSTDKNISHVNDNDGKPVGEPKYYYKALAKRINSSNTFYTVAFKIDNRNVGHTRYNDYRMSVAELEQATGLTFFPQLPNPSIKNVVDNTKWQ